MPKAPALRLSGVAIACFLIAIFSIACKPVTDPDFFWHLASGRYIATFHRIPTHDVFSLTAQNHRWITHEWLTELLFYGGWLLGGPHLLSLATGCIITLTFGLVFRTALERHAPPLLAAPIVLLAALASAHTWGVRPQMLSVLLMALYGLAIARMLERRLSAPPLWVAPTMVLWVNLHGGFIFGLALLSIATVGYVIEDHWVAARVRPKLLPLQADTETLAVAVGMGASSRRTAPLPPEDPKRQTSSDIQRCLLVLALTALATLVNPNGLAGALYPISYLGDNASTRYIAEWVSPDFHKPQYLLFEGLFLLLLLGAMASPRRAHFLDILVVLPFSYLAFQSVRNINLFAVLAAPIAAALIAQALPLAWQKRRAPGALSRAKAMLNWICVLVIAAGVTIATADNITTKAQAKALAKSFPTGALSFITTHGLPARGFNSYNWGGYLIWNWYPTRFVFVDGRPDMYGDRFMDRYVHIYSGDPSWQQVFQQNRLCYALVEPNSGIAGALRTAPGWKRRYQDSVAVLYQTTQPRYGCDP